MKKWWLKLVIVLQLFSMGIELVDTLLFADNQSIELTEKQTEKETEKFEDDCKDKILFSSVSINNISFSHTHQYLEYSAKLSSAYLERVELPPKLIV
jgi:hypothetical protein